MLLNLVDQTNPILRVKGALVEHVDVGIQHLINNMLDTMKNSNGIGLAAHQIGKALQLAVIDVSSVIESLKIKMPLVLINPKITCFGKDISDMEGCLSFPNRYQMVSRPENVIVETLQIDNSLLTFECNGLLSRVIQHEYDHLQGILFIDKSV